VAAPPDRRVRQSGPGTARHDWVPEAVIRVLAERKEPMRARGRRASRSSGQVRVSGDRRVAPGRYRLALACAGRQASAK